MFTAKCIYMYIEAFVKIILIFENANPNRIVIFNIN